MNSNRQRPGGIPWTALTLLLLVLAPSTARSAPVIDLSWNGCSPIVAQLEGAGPGVHTVYVTVTGQTALHKAYEVWMLLGDAQAGLPDAWRFDEAGCQGSARVAIDHVPPAADAAACPAFKGDLPSLEIKSFQLPSPTWGLPPTIAQAVLACAYEGEVTSTDPDQRYFLARYVFDHGASVVGAASLAGECGGLDTGIHFSLQAGRANWLTMDGVQMPFEPGNVTLSFNASGVSGSPVPAATTTWGQIKSQYRR